MGHLQRACVGRVVVTGLAALACVVGALTVGVWWSVSMRAGPLPGTTIGGYQPDEAMLFSDWLELERRQFGDELVRVTAEDVALDLRQSQLGLVVDVAQMLQLSERQRQNGSFLTIGWRIASARLGQVDLAWLTRFDREQARTTLTTLAKVVDRPAVNAEVDLVHRRKVRAQFGSRLDVEQTLDFIETHRSVEFAWLPLVVEQIAPTVRDEAASTVDVDRVLSHFETDFRSRAGTRAINIRVAARALQGQILGPGAVFSFNQVVGQRIETRGYREAPVIVDDEVEPGVGGGVCQVATTLHAAAVLGGLEVVARRSHSRPSGYAPMGLDATVIDGQVDLKLRNPYSVPISIATSFPERFRLRIELLGITIASRVEHTYTVAKRYEFYRRIVTKSDLLPGTTQKKQKGNFGYDVTSTITTDRGAQPPTRRQYHSRYWPVPEVYWVGPNTDISVLPPLPDGATGVQRDGTTISGTIPAAVEERAAEATANTSEQ